MPKWLIAGDRFKYTSREWDSEIGQYFYRRRYYGPGIGRFESEDPLGFGAGDTDFYRYVKNSPTEATDRTGLVKDKPKLLSQIQTPPFPWNIGPGPGLLADQEGFGIATLAAWDNQEFQIDVTFDPWNDGNMWSGSTQNKPGCDARVEGHWKEMFGPDVTPLQPWVPFDRFSWSKPNNENVFLDPRTRVGHAEHKGKDGKTYTCRTVTWDIWGIVPGAAHPYTDSSQLKFVYPGGADSGERLTVKWRIDLRPKEGPFTSALLDLTISGPR